MSIYPPILAWHSRGSSNRWTNGLCAVVGLLAIAITSAVASPMQSTSVQSRRLDPRIGAAVPQRYASVLDAKDWQNPYLVILRDGIEVISKQLPSGRKTVVAADLERTLIGLPVTAWHYGRVAAVQENGVRAAGGRDDSPIDENLRTALATLYELNVTANRWP